MLSFEEFQKTAHWPSVERQHGTIGRKLFEQQALRDHAETKALNQKICDLGLLREKKELIALNDELEEAKLKMASESKRPIKDLRKQLEGGTLWKTWKLKQVRFKKLQGQGEVISWERNKLARRWALWQLGHGEQIAEPLHPIQEINLELELILFSPDIFGGGKEIARLEKALKLCHRDVKTHNSKIHGVQRVPEDQQDHHVSRRI